MKFSDPSMLILNNWDAYQFVTRSASKLQREITATLHGLETPLQQESWWDADWFFVPYNDEQCWIGRKEWGTFEDCDIWIGVENYTLTSIFGEGNPPSAYVWTSNNNKALAAALRDSLKRRQHVGDICQRADCYVIKQSLSPLLPEQAEKIEQLILSPILDWFRFYGPLHAEFSAIRKNLATAKGK